jgi:hypothetical protein
VAIDFRPLPPEHPLIAAGAALAALGEGRLIVHAHHVGPFGDAPDPAVATAYTGFLGFETQGMPWLSVPTADLGPALVQLVWLETAYRTPVVEEAVAREAVTRWLAGFPEPYRASTNGELLLDHLRPHPRGGWFVPVIGATFDLGAILIAAGAVGMLWAVDED